ncbi:MAG: hypothetical protein KGJ98_14125 [Chloroflexota bacterium]|nr:hypothetical protein [Chloroflexota bacterium]
MPSSRPREIRPIGARQTRVYGHRGDTARLPENTLAAFRGALAEGADGIELDVHLTADGYPVVIHDYDLARTTTGQGLVHEQRLDYIRRLSAGAGVDAGFAGERVPLLDEVLELDASTFQVEIKGIPTRALIDTVVASVRNAGRAEDVEFTGHYAPAVAQARAQTPGSRAGLFVLGRPAWMPSVLFQRLFTEQAIFGGFQVVHLQVANLAAVDVAEVRSRGLLLHATDADSDEQIRLALAAGVDQLTTRDPRRAVALANSAVTS